MPERRTIFGRVHYTPEVLQEAVARFVQIAGPDRVHGQGDPATAEFRERSIVMGASRWRYDDVAEFYADLREPHRASYLSVNLGAMEHAAGSMYVDEDGTGTAVSVEATTRAKVLDVMSVFEKHADACRTPAPQTPERAPVEPMVFIGHGRSTEWVKLKNHLADQHGFKIEAYESGARAGHTIRDVLDSMLDKSTFAVLVMTAEDEQEDGTLRPRQNVVHEAGLFQGRLGFQKTVILVEDGVQPFSNLDGIQYITFGKDNIRETYGDVLATLHREFPS